MKVKKIRASFYIFWLPAATSRRLCRFFWEIWRIKTLKFRQFEKMSPQKRIRTEERTTTGRQGRERERECVCVFVARKKRHKQKRGRKEKV